MKSVTPFITKMKTNKLMRTVNVKRLNFSSNHFDSQTREPLYGGLTAEAFHFMVEKGPPYTSRLYKPKIVLLDHGKLEIVMPFNEGLVGNVMAPCLHGGVVATMLDHTAGFCAWTTLPDAYHRTSTVQLIVDYLAPAPCEDLLFVGTIEHQTNRLIRSSATCWTMDRKKQIAFGKAIFNVYKTSQNLAELNLRLRPKTSDGNTHQSSDAAKKHR